MSWEIGQCSVLHCTALYYPELHCTTLHCTALHCPALYCTALHCTTALYCTALHCTSLHYCTVLHCNTLHYCTVILLCCTVGMKINRRHLSLWPHKIHRTVECWFGGHTLLCSTQSHTALLVSLFHFAWRRPSSLTAHHNMLSQRNKVLGGKIEPNSINCGTKFSI